MGADLVTVSELLQELEERLVRGLDLRPAALPPDLTARRGAWKGQPVEIEARGFSGGPIRFCRFVELSGGELAIGNALCLPRIDVPLPILGADLVAPGHGSVMIAADLSPAGAAVPSLPPHGLPQGGELPDWCRRVFSSQALYTRIPAVRLVEARQPLLAFADALLAMRREPDAARSAEICAAQRAYCAAHLEDDKGLGMLARMFGQSWAHSFLHEVMFPA